MTDDITKRVAEIRASFDDRFFELGVGCDIAWLCDTVTELQRERDDTKEALDAMLKAMLAAKRESEHKDKRIAELETALELRLEKESEELTKVRVACMDPECGLCRDCAVAYATPYHALIDVARALEDIVEDEFAHVPAKKYNAACAALDALPEGVLD
jgi:hypothetical protein